MDNGNRTPRQLLGIDEVVAKVGKGRTTIYCELMPNHGFPRPIQIGSQRVAWIEHEIDEWIDRQPRRGPGHHVPAAAAARSAPLDTGETVP